MILFTLGGAEFQITDIFLILFGIGFGFLIAVLLYLILVLITLKPKKYIVKSKVQGLTEEQVDEKIEFAQTVFSDKTLRGDLSSLAHCKEVCTSLVFDIASVYFPDSKRPLYELSVDEVLMLSVYISERINNLLDQKGVRILKKIKVSTIVGMNDVKKTIDDSTLMKATKKYKIKEAFIAVKDALNVINPVYWARRVVVNTAIDYALEKICFMIIAITAEETYKIYSKNVFNKDIVIKEKYSELSSKIERDLEDLTVEEIEEYAIEDELRAEDYNG